MFDTNSTQKRLIIATVISVIFFIAYDYFFAPKTRFVEANATEINATQAAPKVEAATAPVQKITAQVEKSIVKITGKTFSAGIDELGRVNYFKLEEEKYKTEEGEQISLFNAAKQPFPLEVRFSDSALNDEAFRTPYVASVSNLNVVDGAGELTLTQNLSGLIVKKIIKFEPNGAYDLKVELSKNVDYFITPGFRPDVQTDTYTVHGLLMRKNDDSLEIIEDGDAKGDEKLENIDILADSDRYYTTLFYDKNRSLNVYVQKMTGGESLAFVRANSNLSVKGYIGPKENAALKAIDPNLTDVVEYGFFTFISKPMFAFLNWLYGYTQNWGWAIVVLTLVIRAVLFPLTYKGMVSMNKLKDLAPKMKEIQTKYKGDPQKLNAHMMELYKKSGANPMGGCLPILIQIPIFFAIYRVLLNAIELKGAEWILWIDDLATKDPYFVLPLLMGATMFLQQRITPTNFTDPMQEKIMRWLPVIFTFFFLTRPAGLTLYWFVNNLCSVAQQFAVNRLFARHKEEEIAEKQK